jgi:hypothetical protein
MNDLLKINLFSLRVESIVIEKKPVARRKHGGGFIGSSLVLFGGFDGNYFDDLFYVNLFEPKRLPVLR